MTQPRPPTGNITVVTLKAGEFHFGGVATLITNNRIT